MVIYGSVAQDDAYVMPYNEIKVVFDPACLDNRGRWVGSITNDILSIRRSDFSVLVSAFYNAFDLLVDSQPNSAESVPDMHFIDDAEISLDTIKHQAAKFNRVYRDVAPHKRREISERVARPNAISEWLKQLRSYTCQICGQEGFKKRSGGQYAEAHHITELHQLIPGSYCSDKVIVICAECHRKLHYANVSYSSLGDHTVEVSINGERYMFERNVISE
ncbi:MAG TPA: HNH endonuclease [Rubrobacteraceae bacterium]|nr:HNH endonuclease [Rubrobacteraceae bacterium]